MGTEVRGITTAATLPRSGFLDALRWQIFVSIYTGALGLPVLIAPNFAFDLLGLPSPGPLWDRLIGAFLIALSIISFGVYRTKARALVPYSIVVRVIIATLLTVLAVTNKPLFLAVMAGLVWTGVLGSTIAWVSENRRGVPE